MGLLLKAKLVSTCELKALARERDRVILQAHRVIGIMSEIERKVLIEGGMFEIASWAGVVNEVPDEARGAMSRALRTQINKHLTTASQEHVERISEYVIKMGQRFRNLAPEDRRVQIISWLRPGPQNSVDCLLTRARGCRDKSVIVPCSERDKRDQNASKRIPGDLLKNHVE